MVVAIAVFFTPILFLLRNSTPLSIIFADVLRTNGLEFHFFHVKNELFSSRSVQFFVCKKIHHMLNGWLDKSIEF